MHTTAGQTNQVCYTDKETGECFWGFKRKNPVAFPKPICIGHSPEAKDLQSFIKNYGFYINELTEMCIEGDGWDMYDVESRIVIRFYEMESEEKALKRLEEEYKLNRQREINDYLRLKEKFEGKI